jgi:hypothetical protein
MRDPRVVGGKSHHRAEFTKNHPEVGIFRKSHQKTGRCQAQGDSALRVKFDAIMPIVSVVKEDIP